MVSFWLHRCFYTTSRYSTRAVQRARLWAITCTASQAPFGRLRIGGEAARGEMVQSNAVLEVADGVLDLGVAPMVGLQFQGVPSRSVMQPR